MAKRGVFGLVLLTLLAGCSKQPVVGADGMQAQADAAAVLQTVADNAGGKALYAGCAACHGQDGAGNAALHAPSLLAPDATYLKRQLMNFRNGVRGNDPRDTFGAQMRTLALALPDETAVNNVVAYIDSLRSKTPAATLDGNPDKGKDHYGMICGSCHGPAAEGNALLNSPALAGIDDWYLLKQYRDFKTGIRGSAESDKYGYQMAMMAKLLPDEQTEKDVIAYIQSLAN